VQRTATILDETSIGDLAGKTMLESVFKIGKQTRLVKELRPLEVGKAATEFLVR
jgi:hypothetical protein